MVETQAPVDPVAAAMEMLREAAQAEATRLSAAERRHAWSNGYMAGQAEEKARWQARLRALVGDVAIADDTQKAEQERAEASLEQDTTTGVAGAAALVGPSTEAGAQAPVMAAEEDAGQLPGAGSAAPELEDTEVRNTSAVPPVPQPIGGPPNTGGEAEGDRHEPFAAQRPPAPPEPPLAPPAPPEPPPPPADAEAAEAEEVAAASPEDAPRETPQLKRALELVAQFVHPNDVKNAVKLSAVEFALVQKAWNSKTRRAA